MKFLLSLTLLTLSHFENVEGFSVAPFSSIGKRAFTAGSSALWMSDNEPSEEEKKKEVGNLVQEDEWNGLGMELAETLRLAISEDIKKNAREFLGKDDYKLGDISKQVDVRVKEELAKARGKEEYELGDFVLAMDEAAKKMTEELTGKPYEMGDLSTVIDTKVKETVSSFCGKDTYEFGDLSNEIDKRVKVGVLEFTGKDSYEFGDVAVEIENRRKEWAKRILGEEAAANYQFGDLTKKAMQNLTGKDKYEFGDVTKTLLGNIFGGKK